MLTRFTPFSPAANVGVRFGGGNGKKHVPPPISTDADVFLKKRDEALEADANRSKTEGATQADVEEAIRKSGSGRLSGGFARDVKRNAGDNAPSETQLFLRDLEDYIPTLRRQAADPNDRDHKLAKDFLIKWDRKTPPPNPVTEGEQLKPTVYDPNKGDSSNG